MYVAIFWVFAVRRMFYLRLGRYTQAGRKFTSLFCALKIIMPLKRTRNGLVNVGWLCPNAVSVGCGVGNCLSTMVSIKFTATSVLSTTLSTLITTDNVLKITAWIIRTANNCLFKVVSIASTML